MRFYVFYVTDEFGRWYLSSREGRNRKDTVGALLLDGGGVGRLHRFVEYQTFGR
jgi:hypothetical protein